MEAWQYAHCKWKLSSHESPPLSLSLSSPTQLRACGRLSFVGFAESNESRCSHPKYVVIVVICHVAHCAHQWIKKSLFSPLCVFLLLLLQIFLGVGRLWKLGRGAERNYGGEGWVGYFFLGKRCLSATFFLGLVGS